MVLEDALNRILDAVDLEITCIISQGKRQGELYKKRVRYGAPSGHERRVQPVIGQKDVVIGSLGRTRKSVLHIENATIPLTDVETNSYFSPKISHIVEIEGVKIYG